MSSIKPTHLITAAILALALGGCGDKNDKAVFSQEGGHPSDWVITHKTSAREDVASCADCHGENYSGGVSKVSCTSATAASGFTCHATSPVVNMTGCVSCHGIAPFGAAAPNTMSAHTTHIALTGVGCDSCHLNAGSGTSGHAKASMTGGYSKATIALPALFTTGTFGYSADGKCSNVSCHGGKVTPAWSGSINFVAGDNSVCLMCHEQGTAVGVPQKNSFYSGSYSGTIPATNTHASHLGRGAFCTDCHNIGVLTNYQKHFGGVSTNTFVAPDKTIGSLPTKIGSYAVNSKTCSSINAGCHAGSRNWIQ